MLFECPECGAKNRIDESKVDRAVCGRCRILLHGWIVAPPTEGAVPVGDGARVYFDEFFDLPKEWGGFAGDLPDRLRARRDREERMMRQTFDRLNASYFSNGIFVPEIRLRKSFLDGVLGSATYGLFTMDRDRDDFGTITVNQHCIHESLTFGHPWLPEGVLFHEMVHAFLAQCKTPVRFGKFDCRDGAHGPDFQEVMAWFPQHELLTKVIERYSPVICKESRFEVSCLVKRVEEARNESQESL